MCSKKTKPNKTNFDYFLKELIKEVGSEIYTIVVFGSTKGYKSPLISDIDLLIIDKDPKKGKELFSFVRKLEEKYFHTKHSKMTDFLSRKFLVGGDYYGIEPLVIGRYEFDENFNTKSLRLKILGTLFISQDLFLQKIKEDGKIVFGENYLKNFQIKNLNFFDRLKVFTFASFILVTIPFSYLFDRDKFLIWSVKGLKYHIDIASYYNKLSNQPNKLKHQGIKEVYRYRYSPKLYTGNRFLLYFKVWIYIWLNLPFLWNKNRYFK